MTAGRRSARRLRPIRAPIPLLADAIDAFLAQPDLAASSRRSYAQTLDRLRQAVGVERPLDRLSARELEGVAREAWGQTAPATWNRHVATLRSFAGFCQRRCWLEAALADGLERRREPADRTKAIPYAQLDRLWRRDDVAVREKALWRLLYETAARAQEVLSLNVEDLDLENKRARVRSKGRRYRMAAPAVRLGAAAAPPDRRPPARPAVPRRPPPRASAHARRRRPVPVHRPRRGCPTGAPRSCSAPRRAGGRCTSCATPRSRTSPRPTSGCAADGQEPPHLAAVAAALRPPRPRRRRQAHRRARPRTPTTLSQRSRDQCWPRHVVDTELAAKNPPDNSRRPSSARPGTRR